MIEMVNGLGWGRPRMAMNNNSGPKAKVWQNENISLCSNRRPKAKSSSQTQASVIHSPPKRGVGSCPSPTKTPVKQFHTTPREGRRVSLISTTNLIPTLKFLFASNLEPQSRSLTSVLLASPVTASILKNPKRVKHLRYSNA